MNPINPPKNIGQQKAYAEGGKEKLIDNLGILGAKKKSIINSNI